MQNYQANDMYVDHMIGSAYQVVKYIAANMEMLNDLSTDLQKLQQYLADIRDILANMPALSEIHGSLSELLIINNNMTHLLNIDSNMGSLLQLAHNLTALLSIPESIAAMDWKPSVRVATTGNIPLSGLPIVDGLQLAVGDRILVKNQTNAVQNGIYIVGAALWARAGESDGANVTSNNMVTVVAGTVNSGKMFRLATIGTITTGTTEQNWVEFAPENTLESNGTGVSLVGTKNGLKLGVKSLVAGSNVTISEDGNGGVVLSATGGGGGGSIGNIGEVIKAILTGNDGILMDSDGNVLFEETV